MGELNDNHRSLQTLIDSPFPTIQRRPFLKISLPAKMLLQPWKALDGTKQFKKETSRAYLPSKTLASSDCGSFMIRHPILAKRASLKVSTSWNQSPPAYFGSASVDQATQHIFFFSGLASHQNRVSRDCICLHKESGILKQDIV